jgi:hypothetical protein
MDEPLVRGQGLRLQETKDPMPVAWNHQRLSLYENRCSYWLKADSSPKMVTIPMQSAVTASEAPSAPLAAVTPVQHSRMTPVAQMTNAHAAQSRYPPRHVIAQSRHWRATHLIDLSLWQRLYP